MPVPETIAVVTALAAALLFGIAAVADQLSTKRVEQRAALSPRIFADLVRQPLWLTAIAANAAGFALQVVALKFGSLAVVEPLLICDLIFAVLIRSWVSRVWRMDRFLGVAASAAGVAGFLVIANPSAGHTHVSIAVLPQLTIGLAVIVGSCVALSRRNPDQGPLALALACGLCYGSAAFLVKLVTGEFSGGLAGVFTTWPIYVLIVVGPLGFLLNQDAFQRATVLAPVLAIITAADPIVSIALSLLWLGVVFRTGPAAIAGEVAMLVLMVGGIWFLAEHSPQCVPRPASQAEGSRAGSARPSCLTAGYGPERAGIPGRGRSRNCRDRFRGPRPAGEHPPDRAYPRRRHRTRGNSGRVRGHRRRVRAIRHQAALPGIRLVV